MADFITIIHVSLMLVTAISLLIQLWDKFMRDRLKRQRDVYSLEEKHVRHMHQINNNKTPSPLSSIDDDAKDVKLEIPDCIEGIKIN